MCGSLISLYSSSVLLIKFSTTSMFCICEHWPHEALSKTATYHLELIITVQKCGTTTETTFIVHILVFSYWNTLIIQNNGLQHVIFRRVCNVL